jgi:penicillin-binding protein 1A
MIIKLIKVLFYITFLLVVSCSIFFVIIYRQVSRETSELIDKGAIKNIILSESPVFYDDGVTPIGVFFEKTHSKYIHYKDIPKIYLKAIIAAEDKNFFKHPGFDLKAIIRAFVVNSREGKVVQGGSTITQQAAKNIFKREKKSYLIKLKELIQALQIERRFSKEDILEIYANQFFVTGFGKGLSVASEYFFDKEPKDISLVEAAFLAGMVKGPYKYNPFTGKTDDEKKRAVMLAKDRKDYVLDKMKGMNLITEEEYRTAKKQEVPFKEGKVTYGLNVIMDYIHLQLESDYFRNILSEQGVENIATSGINIYTSISQSIQDGALNSIRNQLPILDIQLSGYDNKLNEERYKTKMGTIYNSPMDNLPFFCRITAINNDLENPHIEVRWENGEGEIDYEGLKPIGEAWIKWKSGNSSAFDKIHAISFLENFKIGDSIPVMYRHVTEDSSPDKNKLFLWEIPDLDGGVVVLNQGMIKAMAGGFFDRNFNRAVDAKRQLGSIFKPVVYTAALQLKWNNLDSIKNSYDLYEFENTYYIPRPDHEPKSHAVSMMWAGAKSENLASVWLLYHLTDRLNMSEFAKVTEKSGLLKKDTEAYVDYVKRIRDKYGVIVDETSLLHAAFEEAKKDIEPDVIFSGDEKAIENLNRIHFDINRENINSTIKKDVEISRFSFSRLLKINSDLKKGIGSTHYSKDVQVDNLLPSWIIDQLQAGINKKYKEFLYTERYDIRVLYYVRDFRTLVNLFYVRQLAVEMGMSTPLDAVLSFPLGANSISILEAALTYNTMMNGKLNTVNEENSNYMVPVITKITGRKGELLWKYIPKPKNVLSDMTSASVTEILRMAVENGTARRAKDSVRLKMAFDEDTIDVPIPSYGKTGTSNRFSNSSFAGFIPGIQKGEFNINSGYVIASYVGYDDNRPMKGPYMMVYGASGALPIWIDTANVIAGSMEYKKEIEIADLAFSGEFKPLVNDGLLNPVKISPISGLPLPEQQADDSEAVDVYSNVDINGKDITLKRVFELQEGIKTDDH